MVLDLHGGRWNGAGQEAVKGLEVPDASPDCFGGHELVCGFVLVWVSPLL